MQVNLIFHLFFTCMIHLLRRIKGKITQLCMIFVFHTFEILQFFIFIFIFSDDQNHRHKKNIKLKF